MNPVEGQIIGDPSELNELTDTKGEKIQFERDNEIKDDLVFKGTGSDGKIYSAQLQKKSLIVSVYSPPTQEEKTTERATEERGKKMRQGVPVTGTNKDVKGNDDKEAVKEGSKADKEQQKQEKKGK